MTKPLKTNIPNEHKWPEIVLSSGENRLSQAIRRAVHSKQLRKIAPRIYTSNFKDDPAQIIQRNRYQLLGLLFPNAVMSHRSALEGGISSEGHVVLTYKYSKTITLPGLTIRLIKGPGPDEEDTPFLENLFISSRGRAYLENLQHTRVRNRPVKNLSQEEIEKKLDQLIRIYGTDELNILRDQAKRIAKRLGMKQELSHLEKLIGALLGTRPEGNLKSELAISRALGEPYDSKRIDLFATLTAFLQQHEFSLLPSNLTSNKAIINCSFFESYFSNYIEGTEFAIEEAEKIVFENKIIANRSKDSHDILSYYQMVSNRKEMETVPQTDAELIQLLLKRHAFLMAPREDKMPGKFKDVINRAGNTVFVNPDEVRGTLSKGFKFYQQLRPGIARALFMMFLVAEVHPFLDGNGRIARIMMNAELQAANQNRIIIPTVYREDYLLALRKLSRQQEAQPYVRMLLRAQQFTTHISFSDYNIALTQLQASNAFLEPSEGKLIIPF